MRSRKTKFLVELVRPKWSKPEEIRQELENIIVDWQTFYADDDPAEVKQTKVRIATRGGKDLKKVQ